MFEDDFNFDERDTQKNIFNTIQTFRNLFQEPNTLFKVIFQVRSFDIGVFDQGWGISDSINGGTDISAIFHEDILAIKFKAFFVI